MAEEFDTPLRPPDGDGAVVTLPFMEAGHLGEDWVTAKGDAALGEPVYSVADGWVSVAQDFENAWGKTVFICHRMPEGRWPPFVEVMYAQMNSMEVKAGDFVKRGQKIGTVGTANGTYPAHLHWEVRQTVGMGVGPGYQAGASGWLGPSDFIAAHRGPRAKEPLQTKVLGKDGAGTGGGRIFRRFQRVARWPSRSLATMFYGRALSIHRREGPRRLPKGGRFALEKSGSRRPSPGGRRLPRFALLVLRFLGRGGIFPVPAIVGELGAVFFAQGEDFFDVLAGAGIGDAVDEGGCG